MPTAPHLEARLSAVGIVRFAEDLRALDRAALAPHFASGSGRIVLSRLLRSIIWQAFERIRDGEEPPVYGNLRTFWYRWVKPVLAHIPDDDELSSDPYDRMTHVFQELVMERRLFTYADFDFTDENWENRRIGDRRPELLVIAEKTGWIRFLRELHEAHGVTVLALGGAPSALTSEYTARHVLEALPEPRPARLVMVVDYDPAGHDIAAACADQLTAAGLEVAERTSIIHPRHYSPEALRMFRYPLPRAGSTLARQWIEETGGVDGEPFGLEAESLPLERVRELVEAELVEG